MLNFAVRIKDDQYQKIKHLAHDQKRSVQSQLEVILSEILKD